MRLSTFSRMLGLSFAAHPAAFAVAVNRMVSATEAHLSAFPSIRLYASASGDFDEDQGHIICRRPLAPIRHTIQNVALHLAEWLDGRVAHNFLQTWDAQHLAASVENIGEPIGVEYD